MESVRISFDLVVLMQLNLVRRRLQTLASQDAFVHPDELESLVSIMDTYLPAREEMHELMRSVSRETRG